MYIPNRSPKVVCWMHGRELSLEVGRMITGVLQQLRAKLWRAWNEIVRVEKLRIRWIQEIFMRKNYSMRCERGTSQIHFHNFDLDNWVNADIMPSREYGSGGGLDKRRKNTDKCGHVECAMIQRHQSPWQRSPVHLKMWLSSLEERFGLGQGKSLEIPAVQFGCWKP